MGGQDPDIGIQTNLLFFLFRTKNWPSHVNMETVTPDGKSVQGS